MDNTLAEFVIYGIGVCIFGGIIAILTHDLWSGSSDEEDGDDVQ